MSQVPRLKYVLTPDFHKRLIQKDLGNLKELIPANVYKDEYKTPLTTSSTKIISPLIRFNDAELLTMCFRDKTAFKVNQVDLTLKDPRIKFEPLRFASSKEFFKWYSKRLQDTTLMNMTKDENFKINLNDEELEKLLQIIINGNDMAKLELFLEQETNVKLVVYLLQHLTQDQHEIFQRLCSFAINSSLYSLTPFYITSLSSLSIVESSYNAFNKLIESSESQLTGDSINELINLNLKYSKLSRAKSYTDLLLKNNLVPTSIEEYITELSKKLAGMKDNKLKFNMLTEGFEKIYEQKLTPAMAKSIVPYIAGEKEMISFVSFINQAEFKDKIYSELLNEIISKYDILIRRSAISKSNHKVRAKFEQFVQNLKINFTNFDNNVNNDILLQLYVSQKNWNSIIELVATKYEKNDSAKLKILEQLQTLELPEQLQSCF